MPFASKDKCTGHRQYASGMENRENTSHIPTKKVKLSSTKNVPRTLQVTAFIYSQDLISF